MYAKSVLNVEEFQFIAIDTVDDAAVCHDTVYVKNQEFDSFCLFYNFVHGILSSKTSLSSVTRTLSLEISIIMNLPILNPTETSSLFIIAIYFADLPVVMPISFKSAIVSAGAFTGS